MSHRRAACLALLLPLVACGEPGLLLHVAIEPAALAQVHKIVIAIDDPQGHLDTLPGDASESGISIHTDGEEDRLELVRGTFDLKPRFDVLLVPHGPTPVFVTVRADFFNSRGDLLGSSAVPTPVTIDTRRSEAELGFSCPLAGCTPIPLGEAHVRATMAAALPVDAWQRLASLDVQVWQDAARCSASGFGVVPGVAALTRQVHLARAAQPAVLSLRAASDYVLYVRALDADRKLVAAGCAPITSLPAYAITDVAVAVGPPDELACFSALSLSTTTMTFSMEGDDDDDAGSCGGARQPDRMLSFKMPTTARLRITSSAHFDHVLYLRNPMKPADPAFACRNQATEIACAGPPARAQTIDIPAAAASDSYYLFIDGDPSSSSSRQVEVTLTRP